MLRVGCIGIRQQRGSSALSLRHAKIKIGRGICGDLPTDVSKRQISIVVKHIERTTAKNFNGGFCGDRFKPNLVIETTTPSEISIKDRLNIGSCELEITMAGKKCHLNCPLFDNAQTCDFNKDIFFAKVVKDGEIRLYDEAILRRDSGI